MFSPFRSDRRAAQPRLQPFDRGRRGGPHHRQLDVLREYEAIYPHKILGERVELPRTLGYQAREEQARAKQAAAEEILSLPTLNLKTNDAG